TIIVTIPTMRHSTSAILFLSGLLLSIVVRQRGRRRRLDMTVPGSVRHLLERVRHPHEFAIVPCAAEQLDVDRLSVVVVTDRKNDRRNSVRGARRIAAPEARAAAATIV